MPTWNPNTLRRHYQKRIGRDAGCFEDLLGIVGRAMTEPEYEQRSDLAFNHAWAEYEGEAWNVAGRYYNPASAYFVDDALVVAITDSFRNDFLTCYHEHFSRPHGVVPGPGASVGQRQLRYRQHLQQEEQGGLIRNLQRIRGV
jgi:hypothetical protein